MTNDSNTATLPPERQALLHKVRCALERCTFLERQADGFVRLLELRNLTHELVAALEADLPEAAESGRFQRVFRFD